MLETLQIAEIDNSPDVLDALVQLNNDHAVELSWADETKMRHLLATAFLAQRAGFADALLITFDQNAQYDSENFLWFRSRFDSFVYVDRIVTAPAARNRGLAKMMYRELFDRARAAGHERIVCEVNSDPPNPASDLFHSRLGFTSVGSATLSNGKTVTYLEHRL